MVLSIRIFLLFLIVQLVSCSNYQSKIDPVNINEGSKSADSAVFSIITFENAFGRRDSATYHFSLNNSDLRTIDSILLVAMKDRDGSFAKDGVGHPALQGLMQYRRQYVPIGRGDVKTVWVNCFCNIPQIKNWRKEVVSVEDGGNCYFSLLINLTEKAYERFVVNGLG